MDGALPNERLFKQLRVSGGKRQFVVSGEIQDYFMLNMVAGLVDLETALREYLKARGFEIIVFIKSRNKPEFLSDEMERRFQAIVRGKSVDPLAENSGRNTRTFIPQNRKTESSHASESTSPVSQASSNASVFNRQAEQTAVEVSTAGVGSEQTFLDLLTKLFASETKSVAVFFHPENMWAVQPTENDLHKLKTVLQWANMTTGHPESASILIVNPSRLTEFNAFADRLLVRDHSTRNIRLPRPGKRELEAFLMRLACRYGFFGQLDKIAATAYAKGLTLYNFSSEISDFVRNHPECRSLDGLFSDASQAKTLDELLAEIKGLTGLVSVKKEIEKIIAEAQYAKDQRRMGKETGALNYHMFFLGNPGTGKTMVARLLGQIFWALELRPTQAFVEISYADIISSYNEGETVENMRNKIREASGGVLFIDEFYLFAENEWGRKAFETLMKEMEDNRDNLTVVMAGYEERLPELYKVNPGIKSRINRQLHFPDYSVDEMLQMFESMARKENDMALTDAAKSKLHRYLDSFAKRGGIGNGRGVRNLFEKMKGNRALRRAESPEILAEDLPDPIAFREEDARAIIADLDKNFIGLSRVKRFFTEMFNRRRADEIQADAGVWNDDGMNNCMFLGNPGTGKTSVARRMGNLFHALGLISEKDKLIEVDPIRDFTSQYQSEYAQKVGDIFDRALGGVLFIDEAYQLAKDDQGRRVLDQIVKRLTEPAYANLVVVMAGYPDEMKDLYKANVGLKRRFPHEIYFDDFNSEELKRIFYRVMERDEKSVATSDQALFDTRLLALLSRMAATRQFGNAGTVENFYRNTVKSNQSVRLLRDPETDRSQLKVEDLTGTVVVSESMDDILTELDEKFVGMVPLKETLKNLARRIRAERKRAEASGRAVTAIAPGKYNMRFVGNSGTGKTTIARYMARVFCSLGIIEHPQVKECRGVDLKGSYVGQTKDKVNNIFETSSGSVIVIDEVYGLYDPRAGNVDNFGLEAIDTLVGCITDPRNATTIVVLAGYKDKMDVFLSANQGLASRFGAEIVFPDYTNEECALILENMMHENKLTFPETNDFRQRLVDLFAEIRLRQGRDFGNARTVGGIFEHILGNQAKRVERLDCPQDEDWLTILPEDVPG